MMRYTDSIRYLFNLELFGIKLGLENIKALLFHLGNPETTYPSIHIAGTNGKGSTASMIAAILTASGYRTGLYTSPHLVDFTERIRIDGKKISHAELTVYIKSLRPKIDERRATFFEATTAIAFQYFADKHIDIAVIETGLGGHWDATNVINPILSVITNVSLEHTQYLGDTIDKIANEKSGVIKSSGPCITAATQSVVLKRFQMAASGKRTKLIHARRTCSVCLKEHSLDGLVLDVDVGDWKISNLFVSLAGLHQVRNTQLVLSVIEYLAQSERFRQINVRQILVGLSAVQMYSGFRGRLDVLSRTPLIVADVAHNAGGAIELCNTLYTLIPKRCVLLFGVMRDKAYQTMIDVLSTLPCRTIAVAPSTPRSLETAKILHEFHSHAKWAIIGGSVAQGIDLARTEVIPDEFILITGSHYVVGEAIKYLKISP